MSIKVKQLSKSYNNQLALNNISFEIEKGEIVGFLGPNGAGKSTLMKILTTYIRANEGDALVNGFNVMNQIKEVQKNIGYLPEHNPLYLNQYPKEYLSLNANFYKVNKARVEEVIEMTGLQNETHKKIGDLSKGYRQRVGLASAILHDPKVLILDEPTTGLDPNQLEDIRSLIKDLGKNKTVLLSTHILQEVEAMCNRVLIINKGNLVADQSLLTTKSKKQVVKFNTAVNDDIINELDELVKFERLNNQKFCLTFNEDINNAAELIFDFAVDKNLKILQLEEKQDNIEQLFKKLTN